MVDFTDAGSYAFAGFVEGDREVFLLQSTSRDAGVVNNGAVVTVDVDGSAYVNTNAV